jgi:sugar O-acyltransferase (sialic acid O-acetyltransferase NeuD family)
MALLVIVGAGGLGCDVADMASECLSGCGLDGIAGFLDDRADLPPLPYPLLGSPAGYTPHPDHRLVVAIGDPKIRLQYADALADKGVTWANPLVHPTAKVSVHSTLHPGCVVNPYSTVGVRSVVEPHSMIQAHSVIAHDVMLGEGCMVGSLCFVAGYVQLGRGVTLEPHTTVIRSIVLGEFCRVGPGSVVLQNAQAGAHLFGNPAIKLK